MEDDEPDPWRPLLQELWEDLKEFYLKEVQRFLDREEPKPMPRMLLSMLYYLYVEGGSKDLLRVSKMGCIPTKEGRRGKRREVPMVSHSPSSML